MDLEKFRKSLDQRYPQVCEDCLPKVQEQMKKAVKIAKADYLGRSLANTRAIQNAPPFNLLSLHFVGQLLWYPGLFGQLLWHIIHLTATVQHFYPLLWEKYLPGPIAALLSTLSKSTIPFSLSDLALCSIVCSWACGWWNPKFREVERGFTKHITGFRDWYRYQGLIFTIRILFYNILGTRVLADPLATPTITAHVFIFGFITYLAIESQYVFKVMSHINQVP
jgi:hypothetical protein